MNVLNKFFGFLNNLFFINWYIKPLQHKNKRKGHRRAYLSAKGMRQAVILFIYKTKDCKFYASVA